MLSILQAHCNICHLLFFLLTPIAMHACHVEFDPAKICMLHCAQVVEVRRIDPKVCGGGRGLFATRPISVGTVVAVEEPFLLVPDEREARETLHTALVRGSLGNMHAALHGALRCHTTVSNEQEYNTCASSVEYYRISWIRYFAQSKCRSPINSCLASI